MPRPSPHVDQLRQLWAEADLLLVAVELALDLRAAGAPVWPALLRLQDLPRA